MSLRFKAGIDDLGNLFGEVQQVTHLPDVSVEPSTLIRGCAHVHGIRRRSATRRVETSGEIGEVQDFEVGVDFGARRLSLPVDPCDADAEGAAGDDVVKVALRGVEPAALADPPARRFEVGGGGLVRADLLRRDEEVERHGQVAERAGEEVVIHVGEDSEAVTGGHESLERGIRVGEGPPGGERVGEPARAFGRQGPGKAFCDAQGRFRQHVPVGAKGTRFDGRLDRGVSGENLRARNREAVGASRVFKPGADAELPIDERSVAIERDDFRPRRSLREQAAERF